MRRAPSRQISSSARLISALASSSVTTLNIGVPSSPAITRRSFVLGQRGRYAAPPIRWPIHNFRSYLTSPSGAGTKIGDRDEEIGALARWEDPNLGHRARRARRYVGVDDLHRGVRSPGRRQGYRLVRRVHSVSRCPDLSS